MKEIVADVNIGKTIIVSNSNYDKDESKQI